MRSTFAVAFVVSLVTASNASAGDVPRGSVPIEHTDTIRSLDAAMAGDSSVFVSWVGGDRAWVDTLRFGGGTGAARLVTAKAWQVGVIPKKMTHDLVVLRAGRLYAWRSTPENSTLLIPGEILVRDFAALPGFAGPLSVSRVLRSSPNSDAIVFNDLAAGTPPVTLGHVLSVPSLLSSPPSLAMEGDTLVVRVVGAVPDADNPGDFRFPYLDGSLSEHRNGESSYRFSRLTEAGLVLVRRFKTRTEPRVLEFRRVPGGGARNWITVTPRRFVDPGPDRILENVLGFTCARQRDLALFVDWGATLEWVRWPGGSQVPVHQKISDFGSPNGMGSPRLSSVQWTDTTAVVAYVDHRGNATAALASPDGTIRRIDLDGLAKMEHVCAVRVLHSGTNTIFVWGTQDSIEACAIPDERLRSAPSVPFD